MSKEQYKPKVDPTMVDHEGRTPLHLALLQGSDNPEQLEKLLEAGCDVIAGDRQGHTPLHMAAERGYLGCVDLLLQNNDESAELLEVANGSGLTALMLAARNGQAEMLSLLLDRGASVNSANEKHETALHFAAAGGHPACVDVLLKAQAKINYTDKERNTALIMASKKGNAAIISRLLKASANPNISDSLGCSALHWISECGDGDCAKLLISAGADMDSQDTQADTPFVKAIRANNHEVLKVLIDEGCDRSTIDGLMGTALALSALKGYHKCVQLLIDAGDDPDEIGYFGMTPLMSAAFESKPDIVDLLLQNGADPNRLGRTKSNALIKSLIMVVPHNEVPRHRIIASLLRAHTDVNYRVTDPGYFTAATNGRNCALSFAISSGYLSLVRMLLLAGSHVTCEEIAEWMNKQDDTGLFFKRSELLQPIRDWKQQPMSLRDSCRLLVRDTLRRDVINKINRLPIAYGLRRFLLFEEFDQMPIERASLVSGFSPGMSDYVNVTPCGLRAIEGTLLFNTMQSGGSSITDSDTRTAGRASTINSRFTT